MITGVSATGNNSSKGEPLSFTNISAELLIVPWTGENGDYWNETQFGLGIELGGMMPLLYPDSCAFVQFVGNSAMQTQERPGAECPRIARITRIGPGPVARVPGASPFGC